MGASKPGEPMFADLEALQLACNMLGLELTQKKTYNWWGHSVGDYPVPAGVNVDELGKNAEYVMSISAAKRLELVEAGKLPYGTVPYEIGLVADPNNPGCLIPIYDFFGGGRGLNDVVGNPVYGDAVIDDRGNKEILGLCPLLKQRYDMACDALAAKQAGDTIEFLTAKDAHTKYPQMFPVQTADEDTWVSIVNTDNRIRES